MKPTVEKRTKNAIAYLKKRLKMVADSRILEAIDDENMAFEKIRGEYRNAKDALAIVNDYFFD